MSLALPYPSMVFVPLDVLTADEMNHIVANYEFIANQFPITSDNIDSTTLYEYSGSGHGESGDITLSAPFTDFKYVEILAENLDGGQTSTKVLGTCEIGYLCAIDYYNNAFYLKASQFRVSGTALTWRHNDYQMRLLTNGTNEINANAKWGILKIVGYN